MSKQHELLVAYLQAHREFLIQRCTQEADKILEAHGHLDQQRFEMLGVFDEDVVNPFIDGAICHDIPPEGQEYAKFVEQVGHSEDELILIYTIWIGAMACTDPIKYKRFISRFADIISQGL